ncbi:MAG: transcription-repair coupling factor [Alphaproteobacteria bacterium]|nr:transcription-repair coupling factor [Alphaproteobacteria bacterium]
MSQLRDLIGYFSPGLTCLTIPAWDCLPYDRASPHGTVAAHRVSTLSKLADRRDDEADPLVVVTTVSAVLQRVPPPPILANATFELASGAELDRDLLQTFLASNGYYRAETVREPGEYAIRGGIVDIFPTGEPEPIRLDLFGDTIEGMRAFDPLSQRTLRKRKMLTLRPVSELVFSSESITRFRTGYRELAGRAVDSDPFYEAVSAGRRHPGMEHWLPLFYPQLSTLCDYLPGAVMSFDPQFEEARVARWELIEEYYEARRTHDTGAPDDRAYYPVPIGTLFLDETDWRTLIGERPRVRLSPYAEPDAVDAGGRVGRDFAPERNSPDTNLYDAAVAYITELRDTGRRVVVAAFSEGSRERLGHILNAHGLGVLRSADSWPDIVNGSTASVTLSVLPLEHGFERGEIAIISEQDILGDRLSRAAKRRRRPEDFIREVSTLTAGDLVVHAEHGIGRFKGLETIEVDGAPHDCLHLVYDGGDKLFLPVENLDVVSRFGSETATVTLDRLGGAGWQARKSRVKGRLADIAESLIRIAAQRALKKITPMQIDSGLYDEFCSRFAFAETEDQARSIEDTLSDLANGRPMDRLICGDVGFGKTEVALRAAFSAVMSGFQVAVVVPTTLLARQHHQVFRQRFAGFPVNIAQLSRLVTTKDANATKVGIADGTVDIVVGTQALLARTIEFANLGLLVVDEEQHFGVRQKERLKSLRTDVHVLTLTATPIPRTLQLALTGVRDLSLIASPPADRLAVRTFVMPYDPVVVREAVLREQYRGGQTFYVCPRIEDMPRLRERLEKLVPEVKIVTAHGRMRVGELEAAMTAFYDGTYDVLLSTNIIESGLDLPRVNTLVIHRADLFGLAQLYQLRGRVGRAKTRAYAYLTLPPGKLLTGPAEKRLQVMQTLDSLGAGFSLASYDLDIRGAGNLLGDEQSGHIREVGIELYQQMLEEAVAAAREETGGEAAAAEEAWSPQITIGMPVLLPDTYVPDLGLRLSLYRRIAHLRQSDEIDGFAAELVDRFGPLPEEADNLLQIVSIKALCRAAGVDRIEAGPKGALVSFHENRFADPAGLVTFINDAAGVVKLRPDHKLVYRRVWDDADQRLEGVLYLMKRLAKLASEARPSGR